MKVLLVDDSALRRERLKEMLSEFDGIEIVGEAENRSKAIDPSFSTLKKCPSISEGKGSWG